MKPKATLRHFLLVVGSSLLAISSASADQTWDGGSTGPGDDFWNTAANWGGDTLPTLPGTITFAGDARNGAVNDFAAATAISAISFTNDGSAGQTNAFTLSGNSITLGNGFNDIVTTAITTGPTITDVISLDLILTATNKQFNTGLGHDLLISGNIDGAANSHFNKLGYGTVTLSGINGFGGGLLIHRGTVNANTIFNSTVASSIGTSNNIQFNGTNEESVLNYTGVATSTNKLITLGAAGSSGGTHEGLVGRLNNNGTGALVFTLANLINRPTVNTTTARTLVLGGANTDANEVGVIRDNLANPGANPSINLRKEDAGKWILRSANTHTGTTTVNGGILKLGNALSLQNSAYNTASVASGLDVTGFTTPTLGGLTGSGNLSNTLITGYSSVTNLKLNPPTGVSVSYGGIISNGSGTMPLTKTGAGNQTLTGDNTFTGAVTISDGSITVNSMKNLGSAQPLGKGSDVFSTGRIDISGGTLIYTGIGDTSNRTFDCNGATGTIDASNPSGKLSLTGLFYRTGTASSTYVLKGTGLAEITQKIGTGGGSGVSTTITKSGTGTWILSVVPGQNSSYTGGTNVNEGTLLATIAIALPSYSTLGKVAVASGATLAVRGGTGGWTAAEINSLLTPANFVAGSNLGIDVNDLDSFTYGNNIGITQAAKGLVKSGLGSLTLSVANTYTGATRVSAGTLEITGATQATSSITVDTDAKLGLTIGSPVTAANAAVNLTSGKVKVTGTTGAPSYTLMTASSIVPLNPVLASPIPGYQLVVVGGTQLQLNQISQTPYEAWATGSQPFGGDANGDGVMDGLAFLLGAATPGTNAIGLLPTVSQSGGNMILTFNCLSGANRGTAVLNLQHSSDLGIGDAWASALVPGTQPLNTTVSGVDFVTTASGALIHVVATIPASGNAAAGKLFGRLHGSQP